MPDLKKTFFLIIATALFSSFYVNNGALAQTSSRESLGLYGGNFLALAASPDGAVLLAAVNSPSGIYYSLDGGTNWSDAKGGEFVGSAGNYVALSAAKAFFTTSPGNELYASPLPSSGASSWTPAWVKLSSLSNHPSLIVSGSNALYVGGSSSNTLIVLNFSDNSILQSLTLDSSITGVRSMSFGSSYLYIIGDKPGGATVLLRASVNPDGSLGSPTDLTSNLPGGVTGSRVLVTPTGRLYVAATSGTLYESSNDGSSFSTVSGVNGGPTSTCSNSDGSFLNVGMNISVNGGTSWSEISIVQAVGGGQIRIEEDGRGGVCLFNPVDKKQLFKRTTRGLAVTADISNPLASTWTELYKGIEGVTAYSMGQTLNNKKRVCLGSNAGISITDDFTTGTPPTWKFICPANDCVGGRNVVMSPTDNNRCIVGSGAIYAIDVAGSGTSLTLTDSRFLDKPKDQFAYSALLWPSFLPTTVIAAYTNDQGSDGGIYFYDTVARGISKQTSLGKPISALIALDASIFYAGLGNRNQGSPTADNRGLSKSTDGGTTFNPVSDSVIAAEKDLLINAFAHDSTNDVLYAAANGTNTSSGKIFRLKHALAGTGTWENTSSTFPLSGPGSLSFRVLTVDPSSGKVYVGTTQQVWESSDFGDTWALTFNANPGENIFMIFFDALNSGTSTGLQKVLSGGANPTPTPTATPSACSMTAKCRSVLKIKNCTFSVRDTFKAANGKLEKQISGKTRWTREQAFTTSKAGRASLKAVVTKSSSFRATLKTKKKTCVTSSVQVSVK